MLAIISVLITSVLPLDCSHRESRAQAPVRDHADVDAAKNILRRWNTAHLPV
jgi:hypothetical protein